MITESHNESKALVLIFLAVLSGTAMDAVVKEVGLAIGTWQLLVMRWLFAVIILLPWMVSGKNQVANVKNKNIYLIRALLNCVGSFALFYALANLPLAVVVTIMFAEPLFVIPFAALLLGERLNLKIIFASLIGFGGVFYINTPERGSYTWKPCHLSWRQPLLR